MILDQYKEQKLFFNTNFLEETSTSGLSGYRGELILVEGEVADSLGHSKPPVEVMRGIVLLADDKLRVVVGALDKLEMLPTMIEKYGADFSDDMLSVIYVVNLSSPAKVTLEGNEFVLIPLDQGVPWNEVIDELALEKSDFKGQSKADKIVTLWHELKDYKPKYPSLSWDETLALKNDTVREGWGAV